MAKDAYPRGLLTTLVESGANATKTLTEFREAGGKIRTQTWYLLWGEVQNEQALASVELGKPLNTIPQTGEILPMTTRRATGYMQTVTVFTRDNNGRASTRIISMKTKELLTREGALRQAENIMENAITEGGRESNSVGTVILGSMYSGTYTQTPE